MKGSYDSCRLWGLLVIFHLGCWDANSAAGCISAWLGTAGQPFWDQHSLDTSDSYWSYAISSKGMSWEVHLLQGNILLRDPELMWSPQMNHRQQERECNAAEMQGCSQHSPLCSIGHHFDCFATLWPSIQTCFFLFLPCLVQPCLDDTLICYVIFCPAIS